MIEQFLFELFANLLVAFVLFLPIIFFLEKNNKRLVKEYMERHQKEVK